MRATLEFSLPEEESELKEALDGGRCKAALGRVLEVVRRMRKDAVDKLEAFVIERVRERILAEVEGIDLD